MNKWIYHLNNSLLILSDEKIVTCLKDCRRKISKLINTRNSNNANYISQLDIIEKYLVFKSFLLKK